MSFRLRRGFRASRRSRLRHEQDDYGEGCRYGVPIHQSTFTNIFDAKNDKGEVEKWIAEGNSGTALSRIGWKKDSLKPGDEITAIGNRSKNGSTTMHLRKLVLASGEELPVDRDFEN
jgi:hypothetical protein